MNDFTIDLDSLVLDTDVIELPEPREVPLAPRHGRDGRDAKPIAPELIQSLIADAVARLPRAKDGEPGKPPDPADVSRMVDEAVAEAVARIPRAKDGEPGRSVDASEVARVVNLKVAAAISLLPRAKDGKPGKDAAPALVDQLVRDALARLPKPKDGKTVHSTGDKGATGPNGWTPIPAIEEDGSKAYLKIVDWFGGEGLSPPTGYITSTGLSGNKRDAINICGARGKPGEDGSSGRGGGGGRKGDKGDKGDKGEQGSPGSSTTIEVIADGTVNGHRAVRVTGSGRVALADSSSIATAGEAIGISLTAAFDGDPLTVAVVGEIDEPTFNFTPGPVYFTAIGALTQTLPVSGYVQQIAVALDTTKITVQIGPPIVIN